MSLRTALLSGAVYIGRPLPRVMVAEELTETFSTAYDSKTAADPIDATGVTIPSGGNRVLLDLMAIREDALSDTLDPGGGAHALTKIEDRDVSGTTITEAWELLEASMPAAADYTLRADLAGTSEIFRQVIVLTGAHQTTTRNGNSGESTTQLVVSATRASGDFPAGSFVYAMATDGQGGLTYSVSGDASLVRQDTAGWTGAEGHCFAKGTLGTAKSSVSVTFDLDGTANRISGVVVVVEPAAGNDGGGASLFLPSAPSTDAYWVDPINGSDANTAAQAQSSTTSPSANPWLTLSNAIAEWNAGNLSASGSGHVEIILRGGLSYERGNSLAFTRSGTSGSHLVIKGYRDDIETGTRGGTGKFTGAKGRFVLRGNIEALEGGGWEADPGAGAGRPIFRTASTQSITGQVRAQWLGNTTHNLALWPSSSRDNLDTDVTASGTEPVYAAPGVAEDLGTVYVRMDTNEWTDHFDDYFDVLPTWGQDPSTEPLAVYDNTSAVDLSGRSWIDLSFFNIEYWNVPLEGTGTVTDITLDHMKLIGSFFVLDFGDATETANWTITHNDLIVNIPPWADRHKIHNTPIQSAWDGVGVRFGGANSHDVTFNHNRLVRAMDGYRFSQGGSGDATPNGFVVRNNHFVWCRDDTMDPGTSSYNVDIQYNYFDRCFAGVGSTRKPGPNPQPDTFRVGFNVFDLSRYHLNNGLQNGADGISVGDGLQASSVDTTHGNNSSIAERKYYNNLILGAKNSQTEDASIFAWKGDVLDSAVQTERYNNVVVQTEGSAYHGRVPTGFCEHDYNCWWSDPAGDFQNNNLRVSPNGGGTSGFADLASFKASGSVYNETKHANGEGPGSASGWEVNGKEADPQFVNGGWETIVPGDLSTMFPQTSGNLEFAVDLSATGWEGTSSVQAYVGPFAPGDEESKIGPEQGLWVDD